MNKKVKNANISGNLEAIAEPAVSVTSAEDNNDLDSFAAGEPIIVVKREPTPVEPIIVPRNRGNKRGNYWGHSLHEKPIFTLAGKEIELTEVRMDEVPMGFQDLVYTPDDHNVLASSLKLSGTSSMYNGEKLQRKDCKIYKAIVNNVEVYLSSGSDLDITGELSDGNDYWDYEGARETGRGILVLVASSIECKRLNVYKGNVLNNSKITGAAVYLTESTLASTRLTADESVDLIRSKTHGTVIYSSKWLRLADTNIRDVEFTGFEHTVLTNVQSSVGNEKFSLCTYNYRNKLHVNVNDTTLVAWTGTINPTDIEQFTKDNKGMKPTIRISRRVDYGYFSGISQVPFVRLHNYDLIVGDSIFTAKEMNPASFPSEENKDGAESMPPYGGNYGPRFPIKTVGYSHSGVRMDDTWLKARKLVADSTLGPGYTTTSKPLGRMAEGLVDVLLDQIRSRSNLYVELNAFTER